MGSTASGAQLLFSGREQQAVEDGDREAAGRSLRSEGRVGGESEREQAGDRGRPTGVGGIVVRGASRKGWEKQ